MYSSLELKQGTTIRHRPVTVGELTVALVDVRVSLGSGSVKITPALVPTQSRSRHASSVVTRRQAILCWRMMSSAADNSNAQRVHQFTTRRTHQTRQDEQL